VRAASQSGFHQRTPRGSGAFRQEKTQEEAESISIWSCLVAEMREGMSEIGGEGRGPKILSHESIYRSSTAKPDKVGGGAMAMDSAGYQRRCKAVWSEEIDSSKEMWRSEICPEIAAALLIRARSRTEGR